MNKQQPPNRQRILYLQYTSPATYPPIDRSARWFVERGARVKFLGISLQGKADELVLRPHPLIEEQKVRILSGRLRVLNYVRWLSAAVREVVTGRWDLVYASDLQAYPVSILASFLGCNTVLHEHDPHTAPRSLKARLLLACRQFASRRATVTVVPQDQRAQKFHDETGVIPVVAYNCPSRNEIAKVAALPADKMEGGQGLVLWYHGSISPDQFPTTVIEALARMKNKVSLRFAGYTTISSPTYVNELLAAARRLGVEDRVTYIGAVPDRYDLYKAAKGADIGLALFRTAMTKPMVGASNKPFDYLCCGLPMLVNSNQEWQDFFVARGVARPCVPEDVGSICAVVDELAASPETRRIIRNRGAALMSEAWNYEQQFKKVIVALQTKGALTQINLAAPDVTKAAQWPHSSSAAASKEAPC